MEGANGSPKGPRIHLNGHAIGPKSKRAARPGFLYRLLENVARCESSFTFPSASRKPGGPWNMLTLDRVSQNINLVPHHHYCLPMPREPRVLRCGIPSCLQAVLPAEAGRITLRRPLLRCLCSTTRPSRRAILPCRRAEGHRARLGVRKKVRGAASHPGPDICSGSVGQECPSSDPEMAGHGAVRV